MRTILNLKQQKEFAEMALTHKWSARGVGSSRIINQVGDTVGKARGAGYDRFGAALGDTMGVMFKDELAKLAKRTASGRARHGVKKCKGFYGLAYQVESGAAMLDGACGESCMRAILNALGLRLTRLWSNEKAQAGNEYYILAALLKGSVKSWNI